MKHCFGGCVGIVKLVGLTIGMVKRGEDTGPTETGTDVVCPDALVTGMLPLVTGAVLGTVSVGTDTAGELTTLAGTVYPGCPTVTVAPKNPAETFQGATY